MPALPRAQLHRALPLRRTGGGPRCGRLPAGVHAAAVVGGAGHPGRRLVPPRHAGLALCRRPCRGGGRRRWVRQVCPVLPVGGRNVEAVGGGAHVSQCRAGAGAMQGLTAALLPPHALRSGRVGAARPDGVQRQEEALAAADLGELGRSRRMHCGCSTRRAAPYMSWGYRIQAGHAF